MWEKICNVVDFIAMKLMSLLIPMMYFFLV